MLASGGAWAAREKVVQVGRGRDEDRVRRLGCTDRERRRGGRVVMAAAVAADAVARAAVVAARAVIAGMLVGVVAVIVRRGGVHRAMHRRVRRVELAQRDEPRQRGGLQGSHARSAKAMMRVRRRMTAASISAAQDSTPPCFVTDRNGSREFITGAPCFAAPCLWR